MSLASTISSGDTIAHRLQPLSGPPVQTPLKLYIGLDQTPQSFNLREKVLGAAGANLQYISKETGVQVSLRGIGSLYIEPNSNTELQEPLHLLLEHQRYENLNSAMELAKNLIETLHQEFRQQEIGTQVLSSPHIPTAQLNVPPLNVISSIPPPSVTTPLLQHQQISLVQHQFLPQNGLQMQLGQNAMIIQQQPPNFNMPPPPPQSSLLPMKPTNQIQWQFHQPPPGMSTQHAPIILNTQPQGLQYQYIQQTTTRDMQGNQQITFQPIIQQTQIPMQSQQQYFALQQGNTTYMVPQSSIFQQAPPFGNHPSAQFSIIHQQATSLQHAPHLQVHLPPVNAAHTTPNAQTPPPRNESKTDAHTDALSTSSSSKALLDSGASVSLSHEDVVTEQVDGGTDQPNKLIVRNSPRGMPITSVPPPPINMSVPPPVQHFVGNHLLTGSTTMTSAVLPQQEMVPATPNVQPNSIRNSNSWQQARRPPLPPLGQTLTEVQQLQCIGQQQPFAMTFTQQPLQQQSTQQFVHLQQPQEQQTQFGVIQTSPLNSVNAFHQQQILQLQQIQPQNALQMAQQQIHYSQQQLMQQQEKQQQIFHQLQEQMGEKAQVPMDSTSQAASFSRPGQKRRPATEPVLSSAGGPPPNQKVRTGVGSQSNMTNIAMTSASTGNASKMVEAGGVCGQGRSMNSSQCPPHNHQLLKPTHIGVMRYNQDPHKPVFDIAYPPPRGPRPAQQQTNQHHLAQQLKLQQLATNSCGQRMQIINATQPPPLPASNVYSVDSAPR